MLCSPIWRSQQAMKAEEYASLDVLGVAALIESKAVSPTEVVEAAIDICERRNPEINAVSYEAFDHARSMALEPTTIPSGPFGGVPFLLKEIRGDIPGWPDRMGCKAMAENVSTTSTELVKRHLATGVIPMGKTTSPEFGAIAVTESDLYGDTRNPWNLAHTPGGSSGGAAAAVAAGIAPIAHANDGAGSIRIPASCCGLVGMKPSRGCMPQGPDAEIGAGLGIEHVVTKSLRDTAAMLDATHGDMVGAPYSAPTPASSFGEALQRPPGQVKIAYWTKYWTSGEPTHPECVLAVENTAKLLAEMGQHLDEARPDFDYQALQAAFMKLWVTFSAVAVDQITDNPTTELFEQYTLDLANLGCNISAAEFVAAHDHVMQLGWLCGDFHADYDLLVTTTLGCPPIKIGAWRRDSLFADVQVQQEFMLSSGVANATGQPAISLPLHIKADGLPVGVMSTAAYGREDLLLSVAAELERAAPWAITTPRCLGVI